MRFIRKKNKGQALVEMILILPILVLFLFFFYQFAQITLASERIHMAARRGARLYSLGRSEEEVVRSTQDVLRGIPGPPATVTIVRETVIVEKKVKVIPYLEKILPSSYTLPSNCTMTNDPWKDGLPREKKD